MTPCRKGLGEKYRNLPLLFDSKWYHLPRQRLEGGGQGSPLILSFRASFSGTKPDREGWRDSGETTGRSSAQPPALTFFSCWAYHPERPLFQLSHNPLVWSGIQGYGLLLNTEMPLPQHFSLDHAHWHVTVGILHCHLDMSWVFKYPITS